MPDYDVVVIGGGQAGIPLAWGLAAEGKRVAIIERKWMGGSCVNFGCTPTKAALASAKVAHMARRAKEFGLCVPEVSVDYPAVLKRAKDIALVSRNGIDGGLADSENPKLIRGHAKLDGREDQTDGKGPVKIKITAAKPEAQETYENTVKDAMTITATEVVLNTGTRSLIPPIAGLDQVDSIHAGSWLERPQLPEHIALVGGSYIGLEMGQFYRRMGSEVTIIHGTDQIVPMEDADIAQSLQKSLEAEGIKFRLNVRASQVKATTSGGVVVTLSGVDGSTSEVEATHLFIATGRTPNTDDLGLETLDIELGRGGMVPVDERLHTSAEGVWVAGDIRGGPMFTHTSWDDNRILMSQITGDGAKTTDRVVPYAVFTDPELGRVGMTEKEAREAGKNIRVTHCDTSRRGKAYEMSETEGFIKVIIDEDNDMVLGAACLSVEGSELVHMFVDLMNAGAPYTVIRDAIHIHPTLAEAVQSAVT